MFILGGRELGLNLCELLYGGNTYQLCDLCERAV